MEKRKDWMTNYLKDHNIALTGFMGAGKSTVAKTLSKIFGVKYIETDEMIVQKEGMTINEIFAKFGEPHFRNSETKILEELSETGGCVISCGGGTVMKDENVELLRKNGCIVLLTATPETILERVKDSDERPILKGHKDVDFIGALMKKRRESYENAADIIVPTDEKTIDEVCTDIVDALMDLEAGGDV
ncbi:MAG TPA: shikimate kinase [Candidatus Scybalocola faecipullorum]|nr:shikimate kinase [Candidatus Scybalocola faecipullorum]